MTPRPPRTRRRKVPPQRWWRGRRLTRYGREAISVLVLVGTLLLRDQQTALPVAKREEERPPVYTVDLQNEEGSDAVDLQVPSRPFNGQMTTCRRVHTTINGGCWRRLADTPPCEEAYRWEGGCYLPVMTAERPRTSLEE